MIAGTVRSGEARGRFSVRNPDNNECEIEGVVDTGYTGSLSLPPDVVQLLRLRWVSFGRGVLADGSECLFDVFEASINWDGEVRRILVDEADNDPLIGMELLSGYELAMQVRPDGLVRIEKISKQN